MLNDNDPKAVIRRDSFSVSQESQVYRGSLFGRLRSLVLAAVLAGLTLIGPTGIPEILAQATKIAVQGLSAYPALKQIPFGFILPFTLAPLAIWGILLAIAVYYLSVVSLKVILRADRIDCRVLGLKRELSFSEIASIQRTSVFNSLPILIIRPKTPDRPKILMPAIFDDNKAFIAWTSSFQRYQAEKGREEHELEQLAMRDPALGATPAERKTHYKRAVNLIAWPLIAAFCLAFLVLFRLIPATAGYCALISLPWITAFLAAAAKRRLHFAEDHKSVRTNALISLGCCTFALELEAARLYDLIDATQAVIPAIILFLALTALYVVTLRSIFRRLRALLGFLLMAGVYADASTIHLNAIFAAIPTESYQAAVLDKDMTVSDSRRSRSKHWHLTLAPWGPVGTQTEINVGRELYHRVSVGDKVCLTLHRGALDIQYYDIDICESSF